MDPGPALFVHNQTVKDRQYLFAIGVNTLQVFTEGFFKVARPQPFIQHRSGNVDVLPKVFDIVAPQKQAIEKRSFPLGRQRVEIVSRRHKNVSAKCQYTDARKF